MFRFLLGVIVGAAAAAWLTRAQSKGTLETGLAEAQERANAVLLESRRILEEIRRELAAAVESGRKTVETRTERLRRPTEGGAGPEAGGPQPE